MADLKLDTFIKVLLMTTSDTDGESLAAIRRANSMLKNANTNWEALLRGKVTVVADPFASIPTPKTDDREGSYSRAPKVPAKPQPYPSSRPVPPHYQRASTPQTARQNNTNPFAANCFHCDIHTQIGYGAVRNIPSYGNKVFCEDCNFQVSNGTLRISDVIKAYKARQYAKTQAQAAQQRTARTKRKVTTADLMSDIFKNP